MGDHDLSYRQFFSHLRMIRDLLREIVGDPWVERIDFDSGELVNTSYVSRRTRRRRETDVVWKFRRKDGGDPVYVYILMEFQSRPDPKMPVRLMAYVSHFYQALLDSQPAVARSKLPLVIPIVLNTGREPWNVPQDLGLLIGDLDPSAEVFRPRLRQSPPSALWRKSKPCWLRTSTAGTTSFWKRDVWRDVRKDVWKDVWRDARRREPGWSSACSA